MIRAASSPFCCSWRAPRRRRLSPLTGRVVDQADLLSPEQEAELTGRLEALERASSRQLVVATIADLEGYPIEDYGYRLGRHWGIGQSEANNGIILIVAPNERCASRSATASSRSSPTRCRARSSRTLSCRGSARTITPAASPRRPTRSFSSCRRPRARRAARARGRGAGAGVRRRDRRLLLSADLLGDRPALRRRPALRSGSRGRKYRGRRRGSGGPIVIWGPGWAARRLVRWGGGSWGGGGGFGGGGFPAAAARSAAAALGDGDDAPDRAGP